jgi:Histidine kinase-, DNA gyrase B-, and HSP90-like ATPase
LRELSLHILDIIENSILAGATAIAVGITEDLDADRLEVVVDDNGSGLSVTPEQALDPYYTTKDGKRTGLGLSLFQATVQQAGGALTLGESTLGGLAVRAVMQLGHIDRKPLGDLATTLSSVVCTNPHLELWCRITCGERECAVRVSDVAREFSASERCGLAVARRFSERIRTGLATLNVEGRYPATRELLLAGGRPLPERHQKERKSNVRGKSMLRSG